MQMQFMHLTDYYGSGAMRDPLPVRERTHGPCAGHAVCMMDWVLLAEAVAEKLPSGWRPQVYPHCIDHALYAPHVWTAMMVSSMSGYFADRDYVPSDGDGSWNWIAPLASERCAFEPASPAPAAFDRTRMIALDDLRLMFHDLRRMTRRSVASRATYSNLAGASYGDNGPRVTAYGRGEWAVDSDIPTGARTNAPARLALEMDEGVRNSSRIEPAYCVVDFWAQRTRTGEPNVNHFRHIVRPIANDADGSVSRDGWDAESLIGYANEAFGTRSDAYSYSCSARITAAYYDVMYPVDGILTPWQLTPA